MSEKPEEEPASSILFAFFLILFLAGVFWGISILGKAENERLRVLTQAKNEMTLMLHNHEKKELDPWGMPYLFEGYESEEKVFTVEKIKSAGPDKIYDTKDDLEKMNTDLNWTNAGFSTGKRVGRTAKGFVKGLLKSGDGK